MVTLAGDPGEALERHFGTELAAMLIYRESSSLRVNPARFYESNEEAMEDIKKMAKKEQSLNAMG